MIRSTLSDISQESRRKMQKSLCLFSASHRSKSVKWPQHQPEVWLFFLLPPKWHPLEKVKILRTEISCDCVSKHKQTNKQAALAIKMNERRKWFAFSFLLCWGWKSRLCAHLSVPLSCIPAQQFFSVMTEFLENMGKLWGNVQNPTKGSPHEAS